MPSSISKIISFMMLLAACSPSGETATETDGGPSAPIEDLTVFVYEPGGHEPVPLEGAVVGLSQDGVVSMRESDAEGRATFAVNPEGGPLIASAYLPDHEISSVVGSDPASLRESMPDDVWAFPLVATTADVIQVSGELEYSEPGLAQTVFAGSSGPVAQYAGERFVVPTLRNEPFVLTAYLQVPGPRPSPSNGMQWPMVSFRTLKHEGRANDVDVTKAIWNEHEIAEHNVRVTRPRAPASLADDSAVLRIFAMGLDTEIMVPVAETTAHEPWSGKTSYAATMSGRADLITSPDLTIWATIYDPADGRYSTIRSQGALPSSIDGPFLPPPVVTTDDPRQDHPLSWAAGDASSWTFLYARVGSARWSVAVLPRRSSLDMSELLATLPTAPFRGRDFTAWLITCESEEGSSACSRTAGSATFTIEQSAKK